MTFLRDVVTERPERKVSVQGYTEQLNRNRWFNVEAVKVDRVAGR